MESRISFKVAIIVMVLIGRPVNLGDIINTERLAKLLPYVTSGE